VSRMRRSASAYASASTNCARGSDAVKLAH
jgi:hypothetical protein